MANTPPRRPKSGPKKKLTAAERLLQRQMLAMLEWASERPDKWQKIGDRERAAELLAKRGVIGSGRRPGYTG